MKSKKVAASPVRNNKTIRVILSRKVVHDFVQHNILPDFNQIRQNNGNTSTASNSTESIEKIPGKIVHDSKIVDSNGMQPIILLDRLSANEMQRFFVRSRASTKQPKANRSPKHGIHKNQPNGKI